MSRPRPLILEVVKSPLLSKIIVMEVPKHLYLNHFMFLNFR